MKIHNVNALKEYGRGREGVTTFCVNVKMNYLMLHVYLKYSTVPVPEYFSIAPPCCIKEDFPEINMTDAVRYQDTVVCTVRIEARAVYGF